jgi:hypothetical protein
VELIFFVVFADSANKKLRPGLEDIVASYKLIGLLEGAPVNVEAVSRAEDYAPIQRDERLAHRGRKCTFYSVGLLEIRILPVKLVVLFDLRLLQLGKL